MKNIILQGDVKEVLKTIPDNYVNCVVTSPPYYGLRDYGVEGQLGNEKTPEEYVKNMVEVFREIKRVLKDDGVCWLNLGDSYWNNFGGGSSTCTTGNKKALQTKGRSNKPKHDSLKIKDLIGIPWQVALALREPDYECKSCGWIGKSGEAKWALDYYCPSEWCGERVIKQNGWYLRQDIIWHKPNPMPESVKDRCTKAHEYVFLLTKSAKYYYDHEAIKEPLADSSIGRAGRKQNLINKTGKGTIGKQIKNGVEKSHGYAGLALGRNGKTGYDLETKTKNKRSVWTVSTKPYKAAHFATFPPDLIEPMILSGCPEDGIVLDPFFGAGTTGLVAKKLNRNYIGVELNPEYCKLAEERIGSES